MVSGSRNLLFFPGGAGIKLLLQLFFFSLSLKLAYLHNFFFFTFLPFVLFPFVSFIFTAKVLVLIFNFFLLFFFCSVSFTLVFFWPFPYPRFIQLFIFPFLSLPFFLPSFLHSFIYSCLHSYPIIISPFVYLLCSQHFFFDLSLSLFLSHSF